MIAWLERLLIAVILLVVAPVVFAQSMVLEDGGVEFEDGSVQNIAGPAAGPMQRFEKNGDGTVTDTFTGLIWLENANCANALFFFDGAISFANTLADGSTSHGGGDCNLSDGSAPGDWRVPNMFEALSILDYLYFDEGHPFTNMQVKYWTSTFNPQNHSFAMTFWISPPYVSSDWKANTNQYYVWPVKGSSYPSPVLGQPSLTLADGGIEFPDGSMQSTAASAPRKVVPRTGQVTCWTSVGGSLPCVGTGQDGDHQAGTDWPIPRFTKNGDGTVTDNLTGLIWLEKANCFGTQTWVNALAKANGLFDGAANDPGGGDCGLTDGSTLGEWRLCTLPELQSLAYMEVENPAISNTAGTGQWAVGDPFTDLPLGNLYWWTSTSTAIAGATAFIGFPRSHAATSSAKTGTYYVWPVKDP
jgi:hypothetical protein